MSLILIVDDDPDMAELLGHQAVMLQEQLLLLAGEQKAPYFVK